MDDSDSDDDLIIQEIIFGDFDARVASAPVRHGGSLLGKTRNKPRDPVGRHDRLIQQYFSDDPEWLEVGANLSTPVYSEDDFRRRYRMSRPMFNTVCAGVIATNPGYFEQKKDACGKVGISPLVKITAALRMLCSGAAADSLDENLEMGEQTIIDSLKYFVAAMDDCFGAEYLRRPTQDDMTRILSAYEARGWVGCAGCLDCMHWTWGLCPKAYAGQFKGKERKPTCVLEAICDNELWIWHASFGWPGSMNDLNILDRSDLFDSVLRGESPSVQFVVNDKTFSSVYYLVDGIYHRWACFQGTIAHPNTKKEKAFASAQESQRKDIERCFGVLQKRFGILRLPGRLWRQDDLVKVVRCCVILNNMIVEDQRVHPGVDALLADVELPQFTVGPSRGAREWSVAQFVSDNHDLTSNEKNLELHNALVEHIWNLSGLDDA